MRYGVTLQGVYEPAEWMELVRWIDDLGFDHLWITDSSLHAGDCYVYATLALQVSSRLSVGTAVTNPLTRHPAIAANAFRSLSQLAPGRVICGTGVGDRPLQALGLSMAKLATLRGSIETMRSLWRGEHVEGEIGPWKLNGAHLLSPVAEPPVYVSASQPRALELTGEIADGLILLTGLFPEGLAFAREHVARGRERSERSSFDETLFLYGAIADDEQQAIDAARSIAAWFPMMAPDHARLAGMSDDLIEGVVSRYAGGEFQHAKEAARLISDELVQKIAFCGSPKTARAKLDWLRSEGVCAVSIFPLGQHRRDTIAAFARVAFEGA
jgi:5,10-methylenetetrahydromethanopterin reductase